MNPYLLEKMAKEYETERLKEARLYRGTARMNRSIPGFGRRFFLGAGKLLIAAGTYLMNRYALPSEACESPPRPPSPDGAPQGSFPTGTGCTPG